MPREGMMGQTFNVEIKGTYITEDDAEADVTTSDEYRYRRHPQQRGRRLDRLNLDAILGGRRRDCRT